MLLGSTSFIYDDQGLPIEQIDENGTALYLQRDQLGSTRLLTNGSGAVGGTLATTRTGISQITPARATRRSAGGGQYQDTNGLYNWALLFATEDQGQAQQLVQVRRARRALAEAFARAGNRLDFAGALAALGSVGFHYVGEPNC